MPKPGYVSFTISTWVVDLLKETGVPGDSPQTAIKHLLQDKLGRTRLQEERKKWSEKYFG
jgi:hypothetical protein